MSTSLRHMVILSDSEMTPHRITSTGLAMHTYSKRICDLTPEQINLLTFKKSTGKAGVKVSPCGSATIWKLVLRTIIRTRVISLLHTSGCGDLEKFRVFLLYIERKDLEKGSSYPLTHVGQVDLENIWASLFIHRLWDLVRTFPLCRTWGLGEIST